MECRKYFISLPKLENKRWNDVFNFIEDRDGEVSNSKTIIDETSE